MANLSQEKRQQMIAFLEHLRQEHNDDASLIAVNEIENALTEKKYGLVWEEHSEKVDDEIKIKLPVFKEVKEREIISNPDLSFNFLLEGDNLHSLYLLEKTHKGMIDVIYIDPPYNRGRNDFIYDDDYIVKEDGFRHSKWLSFMSVRLKAARKLLSEEGLIFISIDDCEVAQIKLLCDEIFGENNFINIFVWQRNSSAKTEKGKFTVNTEYVLLFAKSSKYILNDAYKPLSDASIKLFKFDDNDGRGKYQTVSLQKPRDPGPETTYDYVDNTGKKWSCPPKGWRMKYSKIKLLENDDRLVLSGRTLRVKDYWNERQNEGKRIDTLWNDLPQNTAGSSELKAVMGVANTFDNPKPTDLIKRCLRIAPKNGCVLDFFAGSGTTGQAVLELNKDDGGSRKFILCTNNENDICENVTFLRIKHVIDGYAFSGEEENVLYQHKIKLTDLNYADRLLGEIDEAILQNEQYGDLKKDIKNGYLRLYVKKRYEDYKPGIPANLKYFKTDWVERNPQEYSLSNALCKNVRTMIELQNHINVDNIKNVLILNRDDFNNTISNSQIAPKIEHVWVNQNILFTSNEMKQLNNYDYKYIPKEFFGEELREVGE